jgi:N-acetylated-alpha-linked acidic dipeptidase
MKGVSMRQVWKFLGRFPAILLVLIVGIPAHGRLLLEPSDPRPHGSNNPSRPLGFSPGTGPGQLQAEARALAVPTPENARKLLRYLTAEPHVAGTPADYKTAVFVRDKLREWGWKADIAELEVLLNYPSPHVLSKPTLTIERPVNEALSLDEAPVATDNASASSAAFGAFHGYGVSGDAKGQVVYANFGRPEDFETLEKMGIEVKEKIVLVRYGGLFRGLKVRNAQNRGAVGILIYSDPADDGFAKGDVYPNGPFRPGSAIQRGSVQFLSLGPGDPSTPFGPSVKDAKRLPFDPDNGFTLNELGSPAELAAPGVVAKPANLSITEWEKESGLKRAEYFATIPSLPLSYDAAHRILKVLAGPNVPSGWQGGLPLAYHAGPGPAEVAMSVSMNYAIRKIWNVIATIPGTVEPDRWVMVGNHRDAWVYGAVDPGSGTAATLEMCRALGSAVKNGWKPRRTIVYASWDAEEYGLVGSTEWAEEHAKEVDHKAVLMLNVDSAVSGPQLEMSGVPSLRDLMLEAAGAITDARSGKSLKDLWISSRREAWAAAAPLVLADPLWDGTMDDVKYGNNPPHHHRFEPHMGWLGSGSDYTVFLDHLGVPTVDAGFKGAYGVYHSIYDDFNWMARFGDPEFLSHATAARFYTLIVMRAAAAEVVPLRFEPYGLALRDHVDELRHLKAAHLRKSGDMKPGTSLDFAGLPSLVEAIRAFQGQAEQLDRATEKAAAAEKPSSRGLLRLNEALANVERAFLMEKGLPGRPWFKHAVYAPGFTTGYAAWPLPAIRQHLEDHKESSLAADVERTVERIKAAAAALEAARNCAEEIVKAH